MGPFQPRQQFFKVAFLDRCATPDAQSGRRVSISANVVGDTLSAQQPNHGFHFLIIQLKRQANTGIGTLVFILGQEMDPIMLPYKTSNDGQITTGFDMTALEHIGLLKIDMLGLRTLTVIEAAIALVERTHRTLININSLPLNDPKTFDLLARAETMGVFQLESGGMRDLLKKIKPTQFEDIISSSTKRITPVEFAMGYVITRKMRDDDRHGVMVNLTTALRRSFRHLFEVRSYRIFNNATGTDAEFLGLDGSALLSTTHAMMNGSTQSNRPATDLDLSSIAVEAAVLNFHARLGENGLPRFVTPKTAIIDGSDQYEGARVFTNAMQAGTANNDNNFVRVGPDSNGISEFLSSRYFTDTNMWYIVTDKAAHDLTLRVRINPEFQVGSDFRTDNFLARGYARMESGFFNYFQWYGSTGSS